MKQCYLVIILVGSRQLVPLLLQEKLNDVVLILGLGLSHSIFHFHSVVLHHSS